MEILCRSSLIPWQTEQVAKFNTFGSSASSNHYYGGVAIIRRVEMLMCLERLCGLLLLWRSPHHDLCVLSPSSPDFSFVLPNTPKKGLRASTLFKEFLFFNWAKLTDKQTNQINITKKRTTTKTTHTQPTHTFFFHFICGCRGDDRMGGGVSTHGHHRYRRTTIMVLINQSC